MGVNHQRSAEQLRESLRARTALARLEFGARTRDAWAKQTVDTWRIRFAELYERMIGVPPTAHDALRTALEQVRDQGTGTVAEVTARIRQQFQLNAQINGGADESAID